MILPNWDHTPRSGKKGLVLQNSNPELFQKHINDALDSVADYDDEQKIIFLKSWNEWAEGNYIEPDTEWGTKYLEVLNRAISN